jgi:hypothetical protein
MSAMLVPTFADRECRVVSAKDPGARRGKNDPGVKLTTHLHSLA